MVRLYSQISTKWKETEILLEPEDLQDELSFFRMDLFGTFCSEWLVQSLRAAAGWHNKRFEFSSSGSGNLLTEAVWLAGSNGCP
jgi:hypothetical protein